MIFHCQRDLKQEILSFKHQKLTDSFPTLFSTLSPNLQLSLKLAGEKGAFPWLSTLPLESVCNNYFRLIEFYHFGIQNELKNHPNVDVSVFSSARSTLYGKLCYSVECVHFHIQNCAETLVNELWDWCSPFSDIFWFEEWQWHQNAFLWLLLARHVFRYYYDPNVSLTLILLEQYWLLY